MVVRFQGLVGVHTLGGFDWAIIWLSHFSYCYVLLRPGQAIVSNLLGLLM